MRRFRNVRLQIGVIGIDSGQAMVCDPCYVDGQWKNKEFDVEREYKVVSGPNAGLVIDMSGRRFDLKMDELGMTMNEAVQRRVVEQMPHERTHEFSYDGACRETLSEEMAGQLNYAMGHAGVAVVFSTGYGDGEYPVYATYNNDGRISKVEILFDEEE